MANTLSEEFSCEKQAAKKEPHFHLMHLLSAGQGEVREFTEPLITLQSL